MDTTSVQQETVQIDNLEIYADADNLIRSVKRCSIKPSNKTLFKNVLQELTTAHKDFHRIFKKRLESFVDHLTKKEKKTFESLYPLLKKSLEFGLLAANDLQEILTLQNYQAFLKIDSEMKDKESLFLSSAISESRFVEETKTRENENESQITRHFDVLNGLDINREFFTKQQASILVSKEDFIGPTRGEEAKEPLLSSHSDNKGPSVIRLDDWDCHGFQKPGGLSPLGSISSANKEKLSAKIVNYLNSCFETPELSDQKILKKLEAKILKYCDQEKIINEAKCTYYGQRNGPSAFKKANYNISLDGVLKASNAPDAMQALCKRVENLVRCYPEHFYYKLYPNMRFGVPKLALHSISHNVSLIVSINDEIGKASSELIRAYREFNPIVNQLLMIIKLWSAVHGITNDSKGFLSPFAWENLVVGFLQIQGILPSFQKEFDELETKTITIVDHNNEINEVTCSFGFEKNMGKFSSLNAQNSMTLFELTIKFFEFYLERYRAGDLVSIRAGELMKTEARDYLFSIEDPFIQNFNLGSSCQRNSEQGQKILTIMHETLESLIDGKISLLFKKK